MNYSIINAINWLTNHREYQQFTDKGNSLAENNISNNLKVLIHQIKAIPNRKKDNN